MRRNIKSSAILILFICMVFTGVVYASNALNIQVIPNCMNILIRGEKADIDNFLFNNTTYVPLRRIVELLDKELTWDNKTKTIDITDKGTKVDGFYTKCDGIEAILIADVNDHILDLEFQLRNTTDEDITITLHYPYFDFAIYDENGAEVYKHSKEYSNSIALIRDEKVPGGKGFTTNRKIDLTDKKFLEDRIYKVVFHASFEMKSEKKRYKLCDEAYFRLPAVTQTE